MGSYSNLTVANYPIFLTKNSYYEEIIDMIFLPEDFIVENHKNNSRNELIWGDAFQDDDDDYTFKGFRQSAKVCKERLEIFGITISKVNKDFIKAKKIAKEEGIYDFSLSKISFNQYLNEISDIIDKKEINYDALYTNFRDALIAGELAIVGQSIKNQLYSILNVVSEDSIIEYDLSEVINNGWVNENDVKKVNFEKILVLTEGKTDVEFISQSLEKLYPYLYSYYHFLNFDEFKVESNASALVKLVTSFAAANIQHPIIVLFDNDTTGLMEMKRLKSLKLSDNFRILKLPDLNIGRNYPTLGPSGLKKMNINGLACGIEMYLGLDSLTSNEKLIPVIWKNFNEKEQKYHGEISEKKIVQENFRKKLKLNQSENFSEMTSILKLLFSAFQK